VRASSGEVLDTLVWLFSFLESGAASFSTNETETFHLEVAEKRISFNLMDKELLTDFLRSTGTKEKSLSKKLEALKSVAQGLKREGLTLSVFYRGALLLTMGSEAKPTFSQIFTGTDAIEINDLNRLKQLLARTDD
jgi:hypothetical protein